jgi:hypothetical protein
MTNEDENRARSNRDEIRDRIAVDSNAHPLAGLHAAADSGTR